MLSDSDEPKDAISSESSYEEIPARDVRTTNVNRNGILVDDEQLAQEQTYSQPEKPEVKKRTSLARLDCAKVFEFAKVLMVNYMHDDYKFFLKKLESLLELVSSKLRLLIVPLPRGATHVDTYLAKTIQSLCTLDVFEKKQLAVMFINHESHQTVLRHFYKVDNDSVIRNPSEIKLSGKLSEASLLYSWGSAAFG
jgi:hypothetical protein